MKNNIKQFDYCSNCGACYNICPTNAISVLEEDWFYKLDVDENKCINCGKCIQVCPVNNPLKVQNLKVGYGCWNQDPEIVKSSSSGGVFSAIADYVVENDGIVYGAVYSADSRKIVFNSSDNVSIEEIRRSKYVESLVDITFKKIKKELKLNKMVLFCGAPCQVAGLKRYLRTDYKNLITCDFACGGFPSHKLYTEYIENLEKKYNAKVISVNFRSQKYGWGRHAIKIIFSNGKEYNKIYQTDPFFFHYCNHLALRDECYECKFRDNHYSDIILADFWKYKDISDFKENVSGISLILINSDKGMDVFSKIKNKLVCKQIDVSGAAYNCKTQNEDIGKCKRIKEDFLYTLQNNNLQFTCEKFGMPKSFKSKIMTIKSKLAFMLQKLEVNKNEKSF